MGRGGDGSAMRQGPLQRALSFESLKELGGSVKKDLVCLKTMWFAKASGSSHADRLESFYKPQADAYDRFRANFLWGRKPMLAACAARMRGRKDVVWVDLGGGTGENVGLMSKYMPIEDFKAVYVVDLCHSLCEQAKQKVAENGWTNVHVVEADACKFKPEETATLVTFSYSLSMIPPFHQAVDQAMSYLCPHGLLGICDFYVSGKYDLPLRQMSWARRFFWRCIFDTDNIDIGPERRSYLDHNLDRLWEINSEGSIPYVPYLRAPWYAWIGEKGDGSGDGIHHEARVEAPPMFPPTFIYTQSWEDPEPDMEVMNINEKDVCLTLTSGGCNSLNLLLHGAKDVYSVDCNPAQSALLEMKKVAIRRLGYEDTWKLFGEGKHAKVKDLYERELAPFMCQKSVDFWNKNLWNFNRGLYFAGGMGRVCLMMKWVFYMIGMSGTVDRFCNASSLKEQIAIWDSIWLVRFFMHGPQFLIWLLTRLVTVIFLNRFVLWFGAGVPCKQYRLILNDGSSMSAYLGRVLDRLARNSYLRGKNYFYYNCLTGHFARDNCPSYLKEGNFKQLKSGLINKLHIRSGTFNEELTARKYTKVILMDHVDWMDREQATDVAKILGEQVLPGGCVIWRSAAFCPTYVSMIKAAGFEVKCVQRADQVDYFMDRVNMYNSFYVATKKPHSE